MRIAVLGTGMVGKAIATRLVELGHETTMGSRSAENEEAASWSRRTGGRAGTFDEAAADAEIVFNCTAGEHSLEALEQAGAGSLAGKPLIDVANPLASAGAPGPLTIANDDSLAERIQRAHPDAGVVKALNTMNCDVMVDPSLVAGDHVTFICGDDEEAKAAMRGLLSEFGWPAERVLDLGPLASARGMEMYLPLWVTMMRELGTSRFNIAIQREGG